MSQSPITIYVGAGNLNAPHYRFFLDEAGSSEITDLTLLASQTYIFKRLGASNSHPFYISDSGYEKPSSGQLVLTGDGDYENGITGDQSFTLSFSDPSTAPSLSLDFYCTSHSQMIQEVEIMSFPTINSLDYESKTSQLILKGINLTGTTNESNFGLSSLVISNEFGDLHTLQPEYVKKPAKLVSGERTSGNFSGFIREDGSAVIFNNEDKSYILEGDAVDIYGNAYLLAVEQRDGSVKTLIKDGNGNLRHHATLTPDNSDAEIASITLSRTSLINTYNDGTIKWNNQTWITGTPPSSVLNGNDIIKIISHGAHHIALHNDGTLTRWGHRVTEQKMLPNIPDLDGSAESRTVADIGRQGGGLWIKLKDNSFIYYPGILGVDNFSSQYNGNWFDDSNQLIPFLDHPANANYDWNGPNDDLFVSRTWGVHHNGGSGLLVERSDGFLVEYSPRGTTDRVISSDWGNDDKGDPISLVDVYHGFIFHLSDGSIRNSRTGDIYYQPTSENDPQPVDVAGIYKRSILLDDGTIVGNNPYPGDIDGPNDDLTVQKVIWSGGYNGDNNTAALRSDGSVITWGSRSNLLIENASESIASSLQSGIKDIFIGGLGAWYAIDSNNQVIPWGHSGSIDNSILTNVSDYPYYTADHSKRNQINYNQKSPNLIVGLSSDDQSKLTDGEWKVISASFSNQYGDEFGLEAGNELPANGFTFVVDTTAPFLVSEGTQLIRSGDSTPTPFSFPQLNVGTNEKIHLQLQVEDQLSEVESVFAIFQSPSGQSTIDLQLEKDQDVSRPNSYSKGFTVPIADNEGGKWTIKTLTLKDVRGNKQILNQSDLPEDFAFQVNNLPVGSQLVTGQKQIGKTLTIDPNSIFDADNSELFAPDYQYQWQRSDDNINWSPISSFSADPQYTLTEADANKYFRTVVSYTDESYSSESIEGESFQFLERNSISLIDDFEDGANGWRYLNWNADVEISDNAILGKFAGRFGGNTHIFKRYDNSTGGGVFSFDFLAIDSWDASSNDRFGVQVNDVTAINYVHDFSEFSEKSGETNGFKWTVKPLEIVEVFNGWSDKRFRVSIEIPDTIEAPKFLFYTRLNQGLEDESLGIDNIQFDTYTSAKPVFDSESSVKALDKSGVNSIIYSAAAIDASKVKYSLQNADPDLFSIDEVTGQVRLLQQAKFDDIDAEKNSIDFTVRATDPFGNFSDKKVNLTIEDSSLAFWKDGGYRIDSFDRSGSIPSANAVSLKDQRNRLLSDSSSRHWNGVGVIKSNDGYRMLQIGERGRRRGHYRIAELNSAGVLQNAGHWLSQSDAVANGYQELFELDLNGDGHKGIPVATDTDNNGFADGLGHYRLMGTTKNVDFKGRRGTILSARSSRSWDALMSKAKGDGSGFDVLIQGSRGRYRGKYQVWQADADGTVTSNGRWMNRQALVNEGYETTFGKDLDGDTYVGKPPSLVLETDSNNDGFVDGLGHYRLTGATPSDAVDFKGRRGTILSARSSRSWDALMSKAKGDGSGFDVLIQGSRGRYRGKYQVWQADSTGTVTSNGRWVNRDTLVNEGYETTFNTDLNGDGKTGSPLQLGPLDENSDGLVDGITNYTLFKGVSQSYGQAIALTDRRGRNLSDRSSRVWNVIRAAEDDLEFKVLVKGERGRRRSQYQVWTADSTGLITDQSSWQSGSQLALNGFEPIFGADLNGNGSITL